MENNWKQMLYYNPEDMAEGRRHQDGVSLMAMPQYGGAARRDDDDGPQVAKLQQDDNNCGVLVAMERAGGPRTDFNYNQNNLIVLRGKRIRAERDQFLDPNLEQELEEIDMNNIALDRSEFDEGKPNEYLRFMLRQGFSALTHPYEYAKVLMQLGYEPVEIIATKSLFGRFFLPTLHQYIRHIRQTNGFAGMYRGLGPRLVSNTISATMAHGVVNVLGMSKVTRCNKLDMLKEQSFLDYSWNLFYDSVVLVTGLTLSHPFYVISMRQMAQFIGQESLYTSGISDSIHEIYTQEGILGFYAGFIPRLLFDLGVLFLTSGFSSLCNRLLLLRAPQREYNSGALQFGSALLFYPLQLVGACMTCSGSRIAAGAPPHMPVYRQWPDCLTDLYARGDYYRGAFLFRRKLPKILMQRLRAPLAISRAN